MDLRDSSAEGKHAAVVDDVVNRRACIDKMVWFIYLVDNFILQL